MRRRGRSGCGHHACDGPLTVGFGDLWTRGWTAFVLAALGVFQMLRPAWFYSAAASFKSAFVKLSPEQAARLQRVLAARCDAEGGSPNPTRYIGLLGVAMAALEFVPAIPFVVPYAIYCVSGALGMLTAYFHVRRTTQRRTAALVRRSPFDALPPALIAASAGCFAGVAIFAAYSPYRAGAIAVGASMLVLMWIAWRIAGSQAVIFGDDPELEYAVDERLRVGRATGAAALACAPAVVLVGLTGASTAPDDRLLGEIALGLTYVSFVTAMIAIVLAMRRFAARVARGVRT
jgi:hypothetical protein